MDRTTLWSVALLAGVVLMGCTQPGELTHGFAKGTTPGTVTSYVGVESLAREFGLTVIGTSTCHATLRGASGSNVIVVYPDPNGQVLVNGTSLCASGAIVRDGELLVPDGVRSEIRKHLRPERAAAPPVLVAAPPPPLPVEATAPPPRRAVGVVMIDPGHGGKDPGAKSVLGYWEAPVTLAVGLQVRDLLQESGVTVLMTRDGAQTDLDKHGRAALSNRKKPDLYVSIHADTAPRAEANGFTLYVARAEKNRLAAATALDRSLRRAGYPRHSAETVKSADFVVLKDNTQPAVLVELGYLTNPAEAAKLRDTAHQAKYAAAIHEGILDYLHAHGGK